MVQVQIDPLDSMCGKRAENVTRNSRASASRSTGGGALMATFSGAENARTLALASFILLSYDYLLTLDDEVKYFWSGPWTLSRVLFLTNRYLPPCVVVLGLICFFALEPSVEFCRYGIQTSFVLNVAVATIIQAIIVVRIWHLFSHSRVVRAFAIISFTVCVVVSAYYAHMAMENLVVLDVIMPEGMIERGCFAQRPKNFWRFYLPSLILHTILYFLTAMRALKDRDLLKDAPLFKRLLRDGGFFYFVVFASVGFATVASFRQDSPEVNLPAIYSNFTIVITSICVSRVMLSIHSLAANFGSDTAWLLNNVELGRVKWRTGAHKGEIIVEVEPAEDDMELRSTLYDRNAVALVTTTHVPAFHH